MDEDAVLLAIGKLQGTVEGIGREIADLKKAQNKRDDCCRVCKDEIDSEIKTLNKKVDDLRSKNAAQQGILRGRSQFLAQAFAFIGGTYGLVMIVSVLWNLLHSAG